MKNRSNISIESFPRSTRRRPPASWRGIILVLFLAVGSGYDNGVAKAQDDIEAFHYQVDVINPTDKAMCIGETRSYYIRILASGAIAPGTSIDGATMTLGEGSVVTSDVSDATVAEFTTVRTLLINSPDPNRIRPATAEFTLKAKKEGQTNITFSANVGEFGHTFTARPFPPITVKVIPCNYRVDINSLWQYSAQGGTAFASEFITGARLPKDQSDISYVSTNVVWVVTEFIPGYSASVRLSNGQAELYGQLYGENAYMVTTNWDPLSGEELICGQPGCGGGDLTLSAYELRVDLPASGGTRKVIHELGNPAGVLAGTATITLTVERQNP